MLASWKMRCNRSGSDQSAFPQLCCLLRFGRHVHAHNNLERVARERPPLVQGGTVYGGPDPITAALTINGVTETINDSSDGFYFDLGNGTMEAYLQAFNYLNALQSPGLFSDLTTNVPVVANLGAPLPSMLLSNGDFANKDAAFSDGSNGENLDLTVQAVNVPEPSTLSSLVAGLTAGALLLRPPAA